MYLLPFVFETPYKNLIFSCNAEYVEARDGAVRFAPLLGKYCESKPGTVSSTDNSLYLHFFTNVEDPRNGFKAVVSIGKMKFIEKYTK